MLVVRQPVAGAHESVVQGLPSLQSVTEVSVPAQLPPLQTSLVVQALPSSHESLLVMFKQPVPGSHESVVHTLPSLQSVAEVSAPAQLPPLHTSLVVQALPSLHGVLSAFAGLEQIPVNGSQVPASWH